MRSNLWSIFKEKDYWFGVILLALGKAMLLYMNGLAADVDSASYLMRGVSLYQPPGYMLFWFVFQQFGFGFLGIGLIQILVLSVGLVWLLFEFVEGRILRLICVLVFVIEPVTTWLCTSILSEIIFVPILCLLIIICIRYIEEKSLFYAIGIGFLAGVSYVFRYTGLFVLISILILFIFDYFRKWRFWIHLIAIVVVFQMVLIPFRVYNWLNFDTYRFSGFGGSFLWNSVSIVYPNSVVRQHPATPFEHYLKTFPDSIFTIEAVFSTGQIWGEKMPLTSYTKQYNWGAKELFSFSDSLETTCLKILIDQPLTYFQQFIIPNYLHLWEMNDKGQETYIYHFEGLEVRKEKGELYYSNYYIKIDALLFLNILFLFVSQLFRQDLKWRGLSLGIILYLIILGSVAALFPRFVFMLVPFIIILFFRTLSIILEKNKTKLRQQMIMK